jgi:hypothetical protein
MRGSDLDQAIQFSGEKKQEEFEKRRCRWEDWAEPRGNQEVFISLVLG